jgi:hypothetical protein
MTNHESRIFDGQSYHLVKSEPYTRLDGGKTTLSVWQSNCPVCGAPFEVRTPANASKFQPNRRCSKHKRPGIRVNPRGSRKYVPDEHWPDIHDHSVQLADAGILPDLEGVA